MLIDITFSRPVYLWYLLGVPLLIISHFVFLYYTKKKAMVFANFEAMKRVTGKRLLTTSPLHLLLRIIIIICLVFAIAGTNFWYETAGADNDFIIAIDNSASMSAQDFPGTRMSAAKSVAKDLVDMLGTKSKIGLISFSSVAFIEELPTTDVLTLKSAIDRIDVEKAGGTDIAGAIITGTNLLLPSEKGKAMILITDGLNTYNIFIDDAVTRGVDYAASKKVMLYTIGVGRESGPIGYLPEYYNISSNYNEKLLMDLAQDTGGSYFLARDNASVERSYKYIIDKSQKTRTFFDVSFGMLLLGLTLLFIEWGLSNTRFRKIP